MDISCVNDLFYMNSKESKLMSKFVLHHDKKLRKNIGPKVLFLLLAHLKFEEKNLHKKLTLIYNPSPLFSL